MKNYDGKNAGEDDNISPFPADDGYQDRDSSKIPIRIYGWKKLSIEAEAGNIKAGISELKENERLEDAIDLTIRYLKQNSRAHLNLVNEGYDKPTGDEKIAQMIVESDGNLDDLFFLVYSDAIKEKIEPSLGKYRDMERKRM